MNAGTVGAAFANAPNAFTLLRLLAALLVLASHAWVLAGHPEDEPFAPLLAHVTDGGGLAVAAFFALSGFLVARSAERHPWPAYLRARALRLYPAFAVVILLQTFLLAPLATTLPAAAYLQSPETWSALARTLLFSPPPGLPGLFAANPAPNQLNGSLWTLRIEAACYVALLILSRLRLLRPAAILLPLAAAWAFLAIILAARAGLLPPTLADPRIAAIHGCTLHFLMGAALWSWRDTIRPRLAWAAAALFLCAVTARTPLAPAALHLALPYLVLHLGLAAPGWACLPQAADISYGTYLSAFPIAQTLLLLRPGLAPTTLILCAAPLALLYGWLSRHLVETPALRLNRPTEGKGP